MMLVVAGVLHLFEVVVDQKVGDVGLKLEKFVE